MTTIAEPTPAAEPSTESVDAALRRRIRMSSDVLTPPETLAALAADPAVTVRAAIALNPATPAAADPVLAGDADERVRMLLARRMVGLLPAGAPSDPDDGQGVTPDRLGQRALDVLGGLIADEAVRVRAAIADVLKEMPNAPHDLILRLAQDYDLSVSEPVLRLSPMLTERDLLTLLAAPAHPATAACIAGRAGLPAQVCDVIAASADSEAIREMLANPTAAIRETTLDALIAQADVHEAWQAPLIARPALSASAVQALSHIVADHLLSTLANRPDLDPQVTAEIERRLAIRLQWQPTDPASSRRCIPEEAVLTAAHQGQLARAMAMLALAAGVPEAAVRRICATRNAKGLVSLTWQAGFSMRAAMPLQAILARIPPSALLQPGPEQSFPLSEHEMRWQISFLAERV